MTLIIKCNKAQKDDILNALYHFLNPEKSEFTDNELYSIRELADYIWDEAEFEIIPLDVFPAGIEDWVDRRCPDAVICRDRAHGELCKECWRANARFEDDLDERDKEV